MNYVLLLSWTHHHSLNAFLLLEGIVELFVQLVLVPIFTFWMEATFWLGYFLYDLVPSKTKKNKEGVPRHLKIALSILGSVTIIATLGLIIFLWITCS